jgi:TnpA family transposase
VSATRTRPSAFCELGRVIRTGFLLRYISDAQLRSTIQGATNKSEALNRFLKWTFFGGEGIIRGEQPGRAAQSHQVQPPGGQLPDLP